MTGRVWLENQKRESGWLQRVSRPRILLQVRMFGLKVEEVAETSQAEDCDDHIVYQEKKERAPNASVKKSRRSIDRTQSVTFIMLARKKELAKREDFSSGTASLTVSTHPSIHHYQKHCCILCTYTQRRESKSKSLSLSLFILNPNNNSDLQRAK